MITSFLLVYVYGGDDYLVNLKVVQNAVILPWFSPFFPKCTVILPIFYRDFLTALVINCRKLCVAVHHWLLPLHFYSLTLCESTAILKVKSLALTPCLLNTDRLTHSMLISHNTRLTYWRQQGNYETCRVCETDSKLVHGLVESAEVAVVLGCLNVVLTERSHRQLQWRQMQLLRLIQQPRLRVRVMTVDCNLLQYQRYTPTIQPTHEFTIYQRNVLPYTWWCISRHIYNSANCENSLTFWQCVTAPCSICPCHLPLLVLPLMSYPRTAATRHGEVSVEPNVLSCLMPLHLDISKTVAVVHMHSTDNDSVVLFKVHTFSPFVCLSHAGIVLNILIFFQFY